MEQALDKCGSYKTIDSCSHAPNVMAIATMHVAEDLACDDDAYTQVVW